MLPKALTRDVMRFVQVDSCETAGGTGIGRLSSAAVPDRTGTPRLARYSLVSLME